MFKSQPRKNKPVKPVSAAALKQYSDDGLMTQDEYCNKYPAHCDGGPPLMEDEEEEEEESPRRRAPGRRDYEEEYDEEYDEEGEYEDEINNRLKALKTKQFRWRVKPAHRKSFKQFLIQKVKANKLKAAQKTQQNKPVANIKATGKPASAVPKTRKF